MASGFYQITIDIGRAYREPQSAIEAVCLLAFGPRGEIDVDRTHEARLFERLGYERGGDSSSPARGVDDDIFDPRPHAGRGCEGDERATGDKLAARPGEQQMGRAVLRDRPELVKRGRNGARQLGNEEGQSLDVFDGGFEDPLDDDLIFGHRRSVVTRGVGVPVRLGYEGPDGAIRLSRVSTNESPAARGPIRPADAEPPRLPLVGRLLRRSSRQPEAQVPPLHHPVMIVAFEGWNDAGEAASYAARFLERSWSAMPFAEIDPEEFFDFTEVRPEVQLNLDQTRTIKWPVTSFSLAIAGGQGNDVILVSGSEPQLRWRTYCEAFIELAKSLHVERVIMLGAYLGEITHSRPVPISASTHDSTLVDRHGLTPSHYEGPTGILGVLAAALSEEKIPSVSVWASVPCYSLPVAPKAALALTRVATTLAERFVDMTELEVEATDYEMRMNELLAEDENVAAYVERIQEFEAAETEVLSTDGLADEIERYLHRGDEG